MRTSPFIKVDSNKDVHFLVKRTKQAAEKVHGTVTGLFPNAGDVPHSIRLYSALFYLGVVTSIFVYLLYTGYQSTLHTQFLAPYLGNHALPNSNCELIPISYTGNFLVTEDGYWEGSNSFSYNLATYNFDVTAYSATSDTFQTDMDQIYSGLVKYGEVTETQPLDSNLLLWMSLVFVNNSSNAQRFTMTGNPLVVFDRDYTDAAVSSVLGNCNVSNVASFDNTNGHMTVSFIYKDFMAEPKCYKAMDPVMFGYNVLTKPELFILSFDIRSIITGIAVNLGVLKPDQLEEITKYRLNFMVGSQHVIARYYYDPRYAGMDPLRCVTVENAAPFCTFRVNEVVMFPIFHHLGANLTMPEECDCAKFSAADLSDKNHNCNVFRFLSGFLFLSGPYSVSANYVIGLMLTKKISLDALQTGAHRPMFIASSYGQNSPHAEELNSEESLREAYHFCEFNGVTCSFLTFTSYDIVPTSWAVSEYYTLLTNGACTNTITPTVQEWSRVVNNPYGPLVQNYQQCRNDAYQTLLNQAGIAIGNIQVVAPLCVIFLMIVTYLHKWWNKVPLDESYSKAEKDSALDAFSMSLLLSRDGKSKTHTFRDNNSVIALIAEELSEHTMLSDLSHKTRQTQFSMNLSTHSINSTGSDGPSSPTSRIYAKISAFNSRARSGSTQSQNAVTPCDAEEDQEVELKLALTQPPSLKTPISNYERHVFDVLQLESKTQKLRSSPRVIVEDLSVKSAHAAVGWVYNLEDGSEKEQPTRGIGLSNRF